MILYYSATGNSEFCARRLAERCGDKAIDVFNYIRDGIAGEFVSDRPWVFVSPTHGWRLPALFAGFIGSARFAGSSEAYFVMTCGTDIGSAPRYNRALCSSKGLMYRGTLEVVMPENYVAMFYVPGESEAADIVRAAVPVLDATSVDIINGRDLAEPRRTPVGALKSGVVNAAFRRFVIGDRRFAVSDRCVSCGKCGRVCPTRNISLENGRPAWHGNCTHCMACICSCPANAIEYDKASQGKPRYHCPDIK